MYDHAYRIAIVLANRGNLMLSAAQALQELTDGNERARTGHVKSPGIADRALLEQTSSGQYPFAVVLGCADSRLPLEHIFDQAPGNLFVVRVAGNTAGPIQTGSVEFAVESFGTPLVVVLGHSNCGAIHGALTCKDGIHPSGSPNLQQVIDAVYPSVQHIAHEEGDLDERVERAVRANVIASAEHLVRDSVILAKREAAGELRIVGAEYDLATGHVDFFHDRAE